VIDTAFFLEPIDHDLLDKRWAYYALRTVDFKRLDTGAALPSLSRDQFYSVEVALPPLDTQRRIAGILGAYDDLIEVNRRRVAVLEGQARGLFEEWFVRFRFPGHEHHPLQDTPHGPLPQGWQWTPFSELARFTNGFAFKPSDFEDGGLPIVKIPELKNGVTAKTPRNSGNRVPKHVYLDTGDLLFSWSGTLAVQPWIDGPALLNQHLFKVDPFETVGRGFLLASLNAAMPRFLLQGVGATMQHIRRSALDNTAVALPGDQALLKRADQFLAGIYADLVNTQSQSRKLAAARDLLLPRLISGQLDLAAARELETAA
jgi:type I restriction enzyme S subunit